MIENIMEHIAFETKVDPADIRLMHIDESNKMRELFLKFILTTEYRKRREDIDEYNKMNRWRKRGLGITLTEYPVMYFGQFTATVTIYHSDGTVVITHGGIEIGQGVIALLNNFIIALHYTRNIIFVFSEFFKVSIQNQHRWRPIFLRFL